MTRKGMSIVRASVLLDGISSSRNLSVLPSPLPCGEGLGVGVVIISPSMSSSTPQMFGKSSMILPLLMIALVKKLVVERGISVLFTEHSMDVVFAYADRILVLARGILIADGTAESIRDNPEVQQVYLGTGKTYAGAAR